MNLRCGTYLAGQPVLPCGGLLPQKMSPSSTSPSDLATACDTKPLGGSLPITGMRMPSAITLITRMHTQEATMAL